MAQRNQASDSETQRDTNARGPDGNRLGDYSRELPVFASVMRPLVDFAAGLNVGVHTKLLTGFLVGALLLVGMGALSLLVIGRMSQRVDDLTRLHDKVDKSRQMEYLLTAQSHFRAMAFLTRDDANNAKIVKAKNDFLERLQAVEALSPQQMDRFFSVVRDDNESFGASSEKVLALYEDGKHEEALKLHIDEEHAISHVLEAAMRTLIGESIDEAAVASASFSSDRDFLTMVVWTHISHMAEYPSE